MNILPIMPLDYNYLILEKKDMISSLRQIDSIEESRGKFFSICMNCPGGERFHVQQVCAQFRASVNIISIHNVPLM